MSSCTCVHVSRVLHVVHVVHHTRTCMYVILASTVHARSVGIYEMKINLLYLYRTCTVPVPEGTSTYIHTYSTFMCVHVHTVHTCTVC